jgi:hypothetical protein
MMTLARDLEAANFRVVLNTTNLMRRKPDAPLGATVAVEYSRASHAAVEKLILLFGPPSSMTKTGRRSATLFWEYGDRPPLRGELVGEIEAADTKGDIDAV